MHKSARRQQDSKDIVNARPDEVPDDPAIRRAREVDEGEDAGEGGAEEDDVGGGVGEGGGGGGRVSGGVGRYTGVGGYVHADRGGSEGGGVVGTVAEEEDCGVVGFDLVFSGVGGGGEERSDVCLFLRRAAASEDVSRRDTERSGDSVHRAGVIAADEGDSDAATSKLCDYGVRVRAESVFESVGGEKGAVAGDAEDGKVSGEEGEDKGVGVYVKPAGVSCADGGAVECAFDAFPGDGRHIFNGDGVDAFGREVLCYGDGNRVFDVGDETEECRGG